MKKLQNQVAIITGGARGIGEAVCKTFCEQGATVAMWDVLDAGQQAADAIKQSGGNIFFQKVDVTNRESVQTAVAYIMDNFGRIDILINNAGIIRDRTLVKMSEEEWNAVINVNLNSLYITSKAVLPHMIAAKYGRIVSASSVNAMTGAFGQTNYAATKAGIQGFTRSLCKEVGKHGITVNCVAPGFVKTDMTDSIPEAVLAQAVQAIPVGRIGTPEDMAQVYLFLASKEAGFVSGITLHANGGAYAI